MQFDHELGAQVARTIDEMTWGPETCNLIMNWADHESEITSRAQAARTIDEITWGPADKYRSDVELGWESDRITSSRGGIGLSLSEAGCFSFFFPLGFSDPSSSRGRIGNGFGSRMEPEGIPAPYIYGVLAPSTDQPVLASCN